jgi:hypothetical protein
MGSFISSIICGCYGGFELNDVYHNGYGALIMFFGGVEE